MPRTYRKRRVGRRRTALLASVAVLAGLLPFTAAGPSAAAEPDPVPVDRFEGEVPFAGPPAGGLFTWGGDADDHPALDLAARADAPEGDSVLEGRYDISGYGGFSHNFAEAEPPHDWSAHRGLRLWWYGQNTQNTAPLPPGSGPRVQVEIKDGGAHGEASELWTASFTDDWQGWRLVELPFSRFTYRTDYQPVGGIDQVLGLSQVWGYAVTLPTGRAGTFAMDGVELYGTPDPTRTARVTVDAVHPVDEGGTARVAVTVATTGAEPLAAPVTVGYATGDGTATPGEDYTASSGTLTFPAGTESGATRTVSVATLRDADAEAAETVPLTLDVAGAAAPAEEPRVVVNAHGLPYLDARLPVAERVADLLGRMTLAEKAGQMTQAERGALRTPGDIAAYDLGSLLSGGGSVPTPNTAEAWARMVDGFQLRTRASRLQIPLIYGVDAVHGHNNVVGATIMPHNIGLGAGRDPELAERTGEVTAAEVRATGVPWNFSPCLCVTRDERWGRGYESFGEDPALVTAMNTVVRGLQGPADGSALDADDRVLATAKHYVGDGGTEYGSSTTGDYTIDQGVTRISREELAAVHLAPFEDAVERGVGSVMPSYSSLDLTDDDAGPVKMHAHDEMINGVLKDGMRFEGFVISDWQAIDQIPGDYPSDVRTSVNAGVDMVMVPTAYRDFHATLVAEVRAGRVPAERVDDAVARILAQKFRLGLFERPNADPAHLDRVGSAEHRAVAREAVAASQVLLRNEGGLLPLDPSRKVYVAGSNADDIGNQSGGWTITWQGASGETTPGTTILEGMREAAGADSVTYSRDASAPTEGHEVGVVVVGETPYAEGVGDVGNGHDLELSEADRAAVDTVCAAMECAVLIVSGRPQLLGDRLGAIDALVASWLPGTEGGGVADVLYGERPFTGRLPVTWPKSAAQVPINVGDARYAPQYPFGWGLTTDERPLTGRAGALALKLLRLAAPAVERVAGADSRTAHRMAAQARAIVQAHVGQDITARVAAPFAEADRHLLRGQLTEAMTSYLTAHRAAG
ncbi:glycoside hydrolase family 3 N-terminal domain-containing protein [Streptomyces sp. TRM70308]|uniref:glycoside hydrolase family 3 N-terminal domain-containing protein n=1 Tax=Streptomyces sp. TRM70308 TaxID=3131932 RepID=UPI003D01CBEF